MPNFQPMQLLEDTHVDYNISRVYGQGDRYSWTVTVNDRNVGNGPTLAAATDEALKFFARDLNNHPLWLEDDPYRTEWLLNYSERTRIQEGKPFEPNKGKAYWAQTSIGQSIVYWEVKSQCWVAIGVGEWPPYNHILNEMNLAYIKDVATIHFREPVLNFSVYTHTQWWDSVKELGDFNPHDFEPLQSALVITANGDQIVVLPRHRFDNRRRRA